MAVVALALLALIFLVLTGGFDTKADLVEHARWERQLKEDGAWVMW